MGISYNPSKGWSVTKEKTNYSETYTPLKTDNSTSRPTNLPTRHVDNPVWVAWKARHGRIETNGSQSFRTVITGLYALYTGRVPSEKEIQGQRQSNINQGWVPGQGFGGKFLRNTEIAFINSNEYASKQAEYVLNARRNTDNAHLNRQAAELNSRNAQSNEKRAETAAENARLNNENRTKNGLYDKTLTIARNTQGGDYVSQRDQISAQALINAGMDSATANEFVDSLKQQFKSFYQTEKLQRWDPALGSQPPYGVFDPDYYKEQNPTVAQAYAAAEAIDDIDITERYGEEGYYLQHYTNVGKAQNLRGNTEEDTVAATRYTEDALTDKEIQDIRDLQLGIDTDTIAERLLNIPEVSNEWTKARRGDPYWEELAKEKYLDVNKPEDFSVLFRLSERPEDKQLLLTTNITGGQGITQLEDILNEAVGAKAEIDVKKFAALNQSILRDTISEMKRVKSEQEALSFYRGFSGFTEVVDINKTLTDSILGDTGVGGILSFTSAGKAEEDLLGALQNVTGMRNNVTYNWQQWFDRTIKDKYGLDYATFEPLEEKKDIISAFVNLKDTQKPFNEEANLFNEDFLKSAGFENTEDLVSFLENQGEEGLTILNTIKGESGETANTVLKPIQSRLEADIKTLDETKDRDLALSYSAGDVTEIMNIEAQFARDYIDEYLNPRFNTSRSMDEFIEYLDVRQEEQNPFQTQDKYNAVTQIADLYSKEYLDNVRVEGPRGFDPNFYFDPTGNEALNSEYAKQKETVEKDWEEAKAGDEYWAQQAYRFGIDINDKAAFARMHFETKGQGQGFDAADDITNASKIQNYLYQTVLPALKEEAFNQGSIFGQFITPEEFADEMLRGLDPSDTPDEWREILQRYGLEQFSGTVDELRNYIIETLRTGSALDIREEIKYLNEKRQRPTQQILGVTYIERPEDYKDELAKPTTELYAIFQKAGYQGTEDEFYDNFFSDLDRSEQITLTKAGRDERLEAYGLDLSDPFASLGTIESFFPEAQEEAKAEAKAESPADAYTSYFKLGLDDDDEDTDYKSNAGKQFLSEFTSMFKGL